MARRSRMSGDFKLRRTLRNIHKLMDNELRPAMQKGADRILATMQQLIPKDTGQAAAALTAFVSSSGLNAEIGLRGKANNQRYFYLRFLEYGTKGYSGNRDEARRRGRRSSARQGETKVKADGVNFFGKYPDIPARPAHPWLRPAEQVNREYVLADIEAAVRRTLLRASREAGNG